MTMCQWGNQWNDPIIWENIPNYITSANGRKFARHPSGMGTVISMNDGTDRNVLILDAQYRSSGQWGLGTYSRNNFCAKSDVVDITEKNIPFTGWSDDMLNNFCFEISNQDNYSSKENTDYMMSVNFDEQYLAGFCRSKIISHNGIEVGCDAPNINTLIRIYSEMIKLDVLDPTLSDSKFYNYCLTDWFLDDSSVAWSSSFDSNADVVVLDSLSYVINLNPTSERFTFIPILEL